MGGKREGVDTGQAGKVGGMRACEGIILSTRGVMEGKRQQEVRGEGVGKH